MSLSGAEFKVKYPGPYYKFLRSDLTHYRFTYRLGLNVDTREFNPLESYQKEGFDFFNDVKDFIKFYINGPELGIIDIPDDALVYVRGNIFQSNKMILSKIVKEEDELIEFFKIPKDKINLKSKDIRIYAARNGHLEILKWLRENDCPWDETTCEYAAVGGNLKVLKWLRENDCPWDKSTCECAARYGHLEVLKWAIENDCPWNENILIHAVVDDYLEMFKWLVVMGCPWDENISTTAVKYNRFEILKWASENGCPWNKWTYHHAYYGGNKKILEYLEANGCPRL